MTPKDGKRGKTSAFILYFTLIWTCLVLFFDGVIGRNIVNQLRSRSFASTEGRILSSKVSEISGSDSITYGADIRYEFQVNGLRYESDRLHYGEMSTDDGVWARKIVNTYPAGSTQPVYYDPVDPTQSVLQIGMMGQDWLTLMFITPFNVCMVFFWGLQIMLRRPSPPAGGARIQTEGERVLVSLNPTSRIGLALLILAIFPIAGMLILAFKTGYNPQTSEALIVYGVTIAVALWVALRPAGRIKPDLIIDPTQGCLELPRGKFTAIKSWKDWHAWRQAGQPSLSIPLASLQKVAMRERVIESNDGKSTHYVASLVVRDPATNDIDTYDLGRWTFPKRAESFAQWLRETLGAPGEADGRPTEIP